MIDMYKDTYILQSKFYTVCLSAVFFLISVKPGQDLFSLR